MRIAQVAPLWESVPPPAYGGTEAVVNLLTHGLVERGHDVTLFASGDSVTSARLEAGCKVALRPQGVLPDEALRYERHQLQRVFSRAHEFDLIHCHTAAALPYVSGSRTPVVHTVHIIEPSCRELFGQYRRQNYIGISQSQVQQTLEKQELALNYRDVVYNAIPVEQFEFYPEPDSPGYLAFLGRMSPEKGPHLAIQIAKATGMPLKMAGKIAFDNRAFFEKEVEPHIDGEQIQFIGEANHTIKNDLMGRAIATLFPITWQEPFGLVMPESMACGTPLIAMRMGSAPELIRQGETGFICDSLKECIAAVQQVHSLDRRTCREHVALNFGPQRMVNGYEVAYQRLIQERELVAPTRRPVWASAS